MTTIEEILRDIRRLHIKTVEEAEDLFVGAYHSAFKGQGMTFEEVREYYPGDEIRHIDWNVTARMQHPFVKSFREERELTVMLVVDVSASSRFSSTEKLKSEVIAEIAALLAFSAIKNQDNVGLILFSNEIELYLPPGKTLRHVLRIIRELLFFKPRHLGTDFGKALSFLGRVQKKHCICFMISDFLASGFSHDLDLVAKKHDCIAFRVVDSHEQSFPQMGLTRLKDLESGQEMWVDTTDANVQKQFDEETKIRDHAFTSTMNRVGVDTMTFLTKESIVAPMRQFFRMRRKNDDSTILQAFSLHVGT